MAKRGQLTEQIKEIAKRSLGKEISQTELRMMPWAQYMMRNGMDVDDQKLNSDERRVLRDWEGRGWCLKETPRLMLTSEFLGAIQPILCLAYMAPEEPV